MASRAGGPARVDGVADDIFRTLFFGETARVTRCKVVCTLIVNRNILLTDLCPRSFPTERARHSERPPGRGREPYMVR